MRDEDEEFHGAAHEPVAQVSWWPTVRWMLLMVLLLNIVAGVVVYFADKYGLLFADNQPAATAPAKK
jgi:uncharacterized membrane protein